MPTNEHRGELCCDSEDTDREEAKRPQHENGDSRGNEDADSLHCDAHSRQSVSRLMTTHPTSVRVALERIRFPRRRA